MSPDMIQLGNYAWVCLEHSAGGWNISEDECFSASEHHLYAHTSAFARAIIDLLKTAWHSTDSNRVVSETILFLQKEYPEIEKLPKSLWEFDGSEHGFAMLIERFLVTDCSLIIVDVQRASSFYANHKEGVEAVAAVEKIPIIFAAQLMLDSEMGYDGDFRVNQMVEEIEEWLQRQPNGEQ